MKKSVVKQLEKERRRRSYIKWADKRRAKSRQHYAENRDRDCARRKLWRAQNPLKVVDASRRCTLRSSGIDEAVYGRMFAAQHGRCYICGRKETARTRAGALKHLCVDHIHNRSKRVRKLLCHTCNALLGMAHEDPVLLRKAAAYLTKFGRFRGRVYAK